MFTTGLGEGGLMSVGECWSTSVGECSRVYVTSGLASVDEC